MGPAPASFFKLSDLGLTKGSRHILTQLNFDWPHDKKCVGVFGKNGAGKSSLFKSVLGIETQYTGTIAFKGEDIDRLSLQKRRSAGLSGLNQQASLFWEMTVWDNLLAITEFLNLPKSMGEHRVQQVLEQVELLNVKTQKAKTLSGGEQRRLEIARLLLEPPELVILDEPFAGLDAMSIHSLVEMLQSMMKDEVRVMISDHQIHPLLACCDHMIWIEEGRKVADEAKEVFVERQEIQKLLG